MKKLNITHVIIMILFCWLLAVSPFLIPALNTTDRVLGIPLTVFISLLVIALTLIISEIGVRYIWDDYGNVDKLKTKEGDR